MMLSIRDNSLYKTWNLVSDFHDQYKSLNFPYRPISSGKALRKFWLLYGKMRWLIKWNWNSPAKRYRECMNKRKVNIDFDLGTRIVWDGEI